MNTINDEAMRRINERRARLADHAPDLLAMLERTVIDLESAYDACKLVGPVVPISNFVRLAEARALIATIKGE